MGTAKMGEVISYCSTCLCGNKNNNSHRLLVSARFVWLVQLLLSPSMSACPRRNARERMHLLALNTKEGGTRTKTPVPCFLLYMLLVILLRFVILTISNYFKSYSPLPPYNLDVVMISEWFCHQFIVRLGNFKQYQFISGYFVLFPMES